MTDLARRGPLGIKDRKEHPPLENPWAAKKPRKAVRKVSSKRAAYLASTARVDGLARMARVAELPCLVCGARPVEVHHFPSPRSDMRVGPLCPPHHRREFGPGAYHYSRRAFNDLHGTDDELLARTDAMLAAKE